MASSARAMQQDDGEFRTARKMPGGGIEQSLLLALGLVIVVVLGYVAMKSIVYFTTGHDLFEWSNPVNIGIMVAVGLVVLGLFYRLLSNKHSIRRIGAEHIRALNDEEKQLINEGRARFLAIQRQRNALKYQAPGEDAI